MDNSTNPSRAMTIDAERKLLAALCQSALADELRATILHRLHNHQFADPDHQVIHRALIALPPMDHADKFPALTQRVTRLGFPDLDLSSLFKEKLPAIDEIDLLLSRL